MCGVQGSGEDGRAERGRVPFRAHSMARAVIVAMGCWAFQAGADEIAEFPESTSVKGRMPGETQSEAASGSGGEGGETPKAMIFNPAFFTGDVADLSRFTHGNPVGPGQYPLDVFVNGKGRGYFDVLFQAVPDSESAAPCFTLSDLDRLGVDVGRVTRRFEGAGDDVAIAQSSRCIPLSESVPGSIAMFNTADLKLDLSVPQIELRREATGYVDPARWDGGVDAGFVQYSLASYASRQNNGGGDLGSVFLGLQAGVNVMGWRLRQWSTADWYNRSAGMRWQSVALFAQHDVTALKSQLTIGDSSTTGDVFDSFNVRGIQLSSDDRMLPDSMRAYAPIVRGVADTNALVTVRQNNVVMTETSVPPGPFELSDLPATGYGGDLEVTVTESDGRKKTFLVPFASVPQLLRPSVSRFSLVAGAYRDITTNIHPWVVQAVYQRGFTNLLTGYAGGQFSAGYWAGLVGVAFNTSLGAVAFDVTTAGTQAPTQSGGHPGYSMRISYSKLVPGVRTNISVAAYRYSTDRFYSLRDAIYARHGAVGIEGRYDYRMRSRLQLNVNQPVGKASSFYVSGSSQNYWSGERGYDLQYQIGFNSMVRRVSYSLYAARARIQDGRTDTQIGANFSIPLGWGSSVANTHRAFDYLTTNLSRGSEGDSVMQISASGNTTGTTPVNYGINASRVASGDSRTASTGGYLIYRAPFGTYNVNASIGNRTRQAAFNADGAMVMHGGGVTLSPPLGQAFALVEAKGAKGGRVINGQGARIDRNGYAVLPSLTPYRINTIALDPSDVPLEVELGNTSEEVVPRAGSLVRVRIATVQGTPVFADIADRTGNALPMGTELFDESGKSVGVVGQGGVAYLRGLEKQGKLQARWGDGENEQCLLTYAMPDDEEASRRETSGVVARIPMECDPVSATPRSVEHATNHASGADVADASN